MRDAIYPGSFDPVTLGHLNIIERAAGIFDHLVICVMVNSEKHPMFTAGERVALIKRVTKHLPNVSVESYCGLLADYAREKGDCVVVKGLRAITDFEAEFQMAIINRKLNPGLDTMFLTAEDRYMYLSSSAVKEIGRYQADLTVFLPAAIIPDFQKRIEQKREST